MKIYKFKALLQSAGWLSPAYVGVDHTGVIVYLSDEPPLVAVSAENVDGYALPGFQNAHSHAFQYAMAGLAETHAAGSSDDFWSWREAMYKCALSMNPDQVEAVATMLYAEMLRNGYTHVAEFHYLHHDKNGHPYANRAEMAERHVAAAGNAGINITLIPIFYQQGGFGKPAHDRQRRFISKTRDEYFRLLDDSAQAIKGHPHAKLGFGVHSLRAVDSVDILHTYHDGPATIPFHLHAAEQLLEVTDCEMFLKKRPLQWLLDNMELNERFHLVHCTHMNEEEVVRLAESKANAVLCPGTEGNLGDGIFPLTEFRKGGGSWSIGTDSHISLNPLEDLRWLDYAQRFTTHKRNTFDNPMALFDKTLLSGRKAMGDEQNEYFKKGSRFNAVVYNAQRPLLAEVALEFVLSTLLYTQDSSAALGTITNGRWIVKSGSHKNAEFIADAFRKTIRSLK